MKENLKLHEIQNIIYQELNDVSVPDSIDLGSSYWPYNLLSLICCVEFFFLKFPVLC